MAEQNMSWTVWSWGWGHFGQLGHGAPSVNFSTPERVAALEGITVARVACGSAHTTVSTDTGQVYTWGWGVNGQLGHGDDTSLSTPALVKRLQGTHISEVACGLAHTVALTSTDKKEVFSWGWDEYGQLGHGNWDLFGG
ncbi:regulator of chromosome condensation 1/beta-lactamase-inhibitor protein II [Baffinella frigidus]|nr:regulator of chromosome condensation 1/beta-lactamase-inhibitor protein II [Cryptophyta sp. CCMP2293]